jgi:hypothetical protein
MKKTFVCFCICGFLVVGLLFGFSLNARAGTFFDDFSDGNTDGWVFPYYPSQSQGPGQWSVENGKLVQWYAGDGNRALVNNLLLSNQVIEVQRNTTGYAGVVFWHQDDHWVAVNLALQSGICIGEFFNGNVHDTCYNYYIDAKWYDLKVDADSVSGDLAVYLDGVYLFTHHTSNPYRTGLSGVWSGNGIGYFDNFRLTYDIPPISISIDIKPGDDSNTINLQSKTVQVAILSLADFDALTEVDVDRVSLTFGPTGDEQSLVSCASRKHKDVNGDGLKDLVCQFSIKDTGFKCGDLEGILKGVTVIGTLFEGSQNVLITPCK